MPKPRFQQAAVLIYLAWLFPFTAVAAAPRPDNSDSGLLSRVQHAESMKSGGFYQEAISAFKEVIELARRPGNKDVAWSARFSLGFLYWNIGQIDDSETLFQAAFEAAADSMRSDAFEISRDALMTVRTYQQARTDYNRDDLAAARTGFKEGIRMAEALNFPEFQVKFLRQLGMVSWAESRYPEFHDLNQRALAVARALNHNLEISRCLNNIGLYFWKIDEYEQALAAYEESLRLAQDTSNMRTEADGLHNISMIYIELGYFDRAIDYATRSLELEIALGNTGNLAIEYSNIGTIYRRLSQWTENPDDSDKALAYFAKGLDFARASGSQIQETILLNNIATVLSDLKKFGEAKARLLEALAIAEELRDRENLGTIHTNLGIVHYHLGRLEESTRFYQKAIDIALEFQSGKILWEAYLELGNALAGQDKFEEAAENYRRSIAVIEDIRSSINIEEHKAGFIGTDKRLDAYHRLIALLARLHNTHPNGTHAGEAFQILERAKARAFLDSLEVSDVTLSHGPSIQQANREKELAREISAVYTAMLAPELSWEHSQQLINRLDELEDDLKALMREIREQNPAYADLKYPKTLTIKEARRFLPRRNTVYLSFSIGREESWAFALGPSSLKIYPLPSRQVLQNLVFEHRKAVSDRDNRDFSAGARLYRELVEPGLPAGVANIVVVPDDVLHLLPFETLRTGDNPEAWLIEKAAVSYVPSLSVLHQIRERRRANSRFNKDLLAVGDPDYGENSEVEDSDILDDARAILPFPSSFARLRYSRRETERISALFRPDRTDTVLGPDATESAVKSAPLSEYRIIHFAAHGVIDDKKPGRSSIILTINDDASEDGFLQMREIFNLRMNAELVVLSACKTGLGRFIRGEGIEGLARAFFYSGASSVVMSLWAVNDEATSLLMERFYLHLRSSRTLAGALRTAKLEMIRSETANHPYYWAGFILTGKSDTTPFANPWRLSAVILVSLLAGVIALVVLGKRARRHTLRTVPHRPSAPHT
ncbi:MAG: CHAT domain-containing protein [Acidobacteriota bacterium]|nr:CHAT domain-containing protein [Acidobacteriota bacterium]